ncbi:MAG: hypothetical protein ACOVNR_10070 [Chitinophagaceae bacterium]
MKTSIKFTLHHIVMGILFITKGLGKINHHPLIAIFFLVIGLSIFSFYCWMKMKQKQNGFLKNLMHLLEGIALITTAYIFWQEGKHWLPYFTLIAALFFLFLFFKEWKNKIIS